MCSSMDSAAPSAHSDIALSINLSSSTGTGTRLYNLSRYDFAHAIAT